MMNRAVILASRPTGMPSAQNFELADFPMPEVGEGQFVVKNLFISLDPGIRQRLSQVDSYVKIIDVGAPLTTTTLGVVAASCDDRVKEGDHVIGFHTLSDYSLANWGPLTRKIEPGSALSLSNYLSVLGPTGLTAYFGLLDIGDPKPAETVLVSAAAGAVGSIAAQIAKIKGCRVVGITGGAEKTNRLIAEFGIDAAIDYRNKDMAALTHAIKEAAPAGIDVFFDNVGGIQLDAALDCLNPHARVVLCGLIAQYNAAGAVPPLTNLFKLIAKSARMEGFVYLSYADRFDTALADLPAWIRAGKLVFREEIVDGIEQAIPGFLRLFEGRNQGKLMVRLAG